MHQFNYYFFANMNSFNCLANSRLNEHKNEVSLVLPTPGLASVAPYRNPRHKDINVSYVRINLKGP